MNLGEKKISQIPDLNHVEVLWNYLRRVIHTRSDPTNVWVEAVLLRGMVKDSSWIFYRYDPELQRLKSWLPKSFNSKGSFTFSSSALNF